MKYFISFLFVILILFNVNLSLAAENNANSKTILILDSSGSMWGQIDGKNKVTIARETIKDLVKDWKEKNYLGLMSYGHNKKGDCSDIEEIIPVSKINKSAFVKKVNSLNPKGKTPISASLKKAAEILKYEEEASTVILVTDGLETCEADPCTVSKELEKNGINFTAHVIAFDLNEKEAKSLKCIADNTGGMFLTANNAGELKTAMGKIAKEAVKPKYNLEINSKLSKDSEILDSYHSFIYYYIYKIDENGKVGKKYIDTSYAIQPRFNLPEGKYKLQIKISNTIDKWQEFAIEKGKITELIINLAVGDLQVKPKLSEASEILDNYHSFIYYYIYKINDDGKPAKNYLTYSYDIWPKFTLSAGRYRIQAKIENTINKWQEFEVKAGETTKIALNLNAGDVSIIPKMSKTDKIPSGNYYYNIYKLDENNKIAEDYLTYSYDTEPKFTLPAGKYRAVLTINDNKEQSQDFEIKAGEKSNIIIELK